MRWSEKSPTRVDLAGGTLDCWPLHLLVGDCVTVNLAISISTYATLEPLEDKRIEIHLRDLKVRETFTDLDAFIASQNADLKLTQIHAAFWRPTRGFRLETFSESPVGGGLGGSSSLSISLIKVFSAWMQKTFDKYAMVNLAHNLEAQVLGKMTGTQDYFPALVPALNAIHYTPLGIELETIPTPPQVWNDSMSLVYTGQPHRSGLNNWQVLKAALDGDKATLGALADLRRVASELYAAVKESAWNKLAGLFEKEFEARVRLASSFSSPEIMRLKDVALKSGAQAVKICGAGGGGCVLVWSLPERRQRVEAECRAQGFEVLEVKAVQ